MHRRTRLRFLTSVLGTALAITAMAAPAEAATAYTVQTLHFKVKVGPGQATTCDIIGDLYLPKSATPSKRVPAILTTNGFGGSKDDQSGIGVGMANRGYAVLSYSGLGFGGSDCKITLDDWLWDGKAASQLISYLGGKTGIAFLDDAHTKPAPRLQVVSRDNGPKFDPRVGMIGGSYGGQIQFAAAGVDRRIDTIVPIITWNDLSYSLGPNNTTQSGANVTSSVVGVTKLTWGLLFSTLGVVKGLQNAQTDPSRIVPCPNFATFVCPALVLAGTTGYFDASSRAALRHASVATYMKNIRIPVLLMQGEADTLFNLNEAIATYAALRKQGTPVKMIWHSWGHSQGTPAPGEFDLHALNPKKQYQSARVVNWFEHYLKKRTSVSTGPGFAYFRDWVKYTGTATPAFGVAARYPVGSTRNFYLSGTYLSGTSKGLKSQVLSFLTTALPTSTNELDAVGGYAQIPVPELDVPGTFVAWNSAKQTKNLDVVGPPKLTLKVKAPAAALTQSAGATGQLVLFARLQDVGTDGKAKDIRWLTAPVRIADVNKPFTITMPAIVHRFAKGHRVRLVLSSSSLNYRGGLVPVQPVQIGTGSTGQVLRLPVVP